MEEKLERKPSVNKSTDAGCSDLVGKRWAWIEPESGRESQQEKEQVFGQAGMASEYSEASGL